MVTSYAFLFLLYSGPRGSLYGHLRQRMVAVSFTVVSVNSWRFKTPTVPVGSRRRHDSWWPIYPGFSESFKAGFVLFLLKTSRLNRRWRVSRALSSDLDATSGRRAPGHIVRILLHLRPLVVPSLDVPVNVSWSKPSRLAAVPVYSRWS